MPLSTTSEIWLQWGSEMNNETKSPIALDNGIARPRSMPRIPGRDEPPVKSPIAMSDMELQTEADALAHRIAQGKATAGDSMTVIEMANRWIVARAFGGAP